MVIQPPSEQHSKIISAILSGEARLHFSQMGEDCLIWHFFADTQNGFYVDVGCHHPFRYSNTALLSIFNGWRGLNIDADQHAIDLFQQHRPNDINVCCAVGNNSGSAEAFIFKDGAVNTLDPAWADRQTANFGTAQKRIVTVRPLRELLHQHVPSGAAIDLMNIDIEGFDQQALESNDWQRYRPKLVFVEAHNFDINVPSDNSTFRFMQTVRYKMIAHMYATSVYQPIQ